MDLLFGSAQGSGIWFSPFVLRSCICIFEAKSPILAIAFLFRSLQKISLRRNSSNTPPSQQTVAIRLYYLGTRKTTINRCPYNITSDGYKIRIHHPKLTWNLTRSPMKRTVVYKGLLGLALVHEPLDQPLGFLCEPQNKKVLSQISC